MRQLVPAALLLGLALSLGACADMNGEAPGGGSVRGGGRPILGLGPAAVRQMLGEPSLRRAEPPGDYWRYTLDGCAIGVFFFKQPGASEERVTYYDARSMIAGADRCTAWRAKLGSPGT